MTTVERTAPPAAGQPSRTSTKLDSLIAAQRWWVALEFAGLIAFQSFHQLEHTLELLQKRLMVHTHPLLSGVNFEWAHFFGNTLLFVCTLAVIFGAGRWGRERWRTANPVAWRVFVAAVVVQGTHVIEHVVRIIQYVQTGKDPRGFATIWIDPVWFHFSINLVFLYGLLVGFFGMGVHRDLVRRRRLGVPAAPAG